MTRKEGGRPGPNLGSVSSHFSALRSPCSPTEPQFFSLVKWDDKPFLTLKKGGLSKKDGGPGPRAG